MALAGTKCRRAGLSEVATHLYGRVLDECCVCLTRGISPAMGPAITAPAPGIDLTPLKGKRMTVHLSRDLGLANPTRPKGIRIKRF